MVLKQHSTLQRLLRHIRSLEFALLRLALVPRALLRKFHVFSRRCPNRTILLASPAFSHEPLLHTAAAAVIFHDRCDRDCTYWILGRHLGGFAVVDEDSPRDMYTCAHFPRRYRCDTALKSGICSRKCRWCLAILLLSSSHPSPSSYC